jgi:hypothetical protein
MVVHYTLAPYEGKISTFLLQLRGECAKKIRFFPSVANVGLWIYSRGCNICFRFHALFSKVGDDGKPRL